VLEEQGAGRKLLLTSFDDLDPSRTTRHIPASNSSTRISAFSIYQTTCALVTFQACAPGTFIPGACHHSSHDWVT
jgi:hypothetical protein